MANLTQRQVLLDLQRFFRIYSVDIKPSGCITKYFRFLVSLEKAKRSVTMDLQLGVAEKLSGSVCFPVLRLTAYPLVSLAQPRLLSLRLASEALEFETLEKRLITHSRAGKSPGVPAS